MDEQTIEVQVTKPEVTPSLNALDVSGNPEARGPANAVESEKNTKDTAGANKSADTAQEVERGNLPSVQLVDDLAPGQQNPGDKPAKVSNDAQPDDAQPEKALEARNPQAQLSAAEIERVSYLQENLTRLLPKIWKVEAGRDADKNREQVKKELEELTRKIKAERDAEKFGPATQEAYQRFLDWYQKEAVPATVVAFDSMGLQMPPGCPCDLPLNENGRPIRPQLYKNLVALDDVKFHSGLDATKVPDDGQLDAMEKGLDWLETANRKYEEAMLKRQEEVLSEMIREERLPEKWLRKSGEDLGAWVASSAEMVDLASRTRNYIEAMHSMYKASAYGDFPFKLPAGTSITIEVDGKQHTIKAGEEKQNDWILRNKKGNVSTVSLDLPEDLRQEHPANQAKIERMRQWLDSEQCNQIEKSLAEYLKVQQRPESVIMYGDQPIHDGHGRDLQGRFDSNGGLLGIVDANAYKAKNGESVRELNLLGYDFDVTKTDDGQIIVDQTIQGWDMPWYAYQDIRAFGDKVGKPMSFAKPVPENFDKDYEAFQISVKGEKRTLYRHKDDASDVVEFVADANSPDRKLKQVKLYQPNDFVPVRDGGDMRIMKAKDLGRFLSNEKAFYYGSKGLMIALDAAMLVTGTIELAAVTKGAQLAASTGMRLAAREVAIQGTKATSRIVVGGAGIFSNSGAMNTEWGRGINTARGVYFLGDISQGLLRGGVGLARGLRAADSSLQTARALTSAQKVHSIINGTKTVDGAKALEGMGWVSSAHKSANVTFRATEFGFAPIVGRDLLKQVKQIDEHGARNPIEDALIQVGDGRGLQKPSKNAFDMSNARSLEAAREVMDGYMENLSDGRSPEVSRAVKDVLSEAKRLLGPDATAAERKSFKDKVVFNVSFNPEEIKELEQTRRPILDSGSSARDYYKHIQLTPVELQKLLDKDQRGEVSPPELQRKAEEILARKNPDLMVASLIALTYLSRGDNGSVEKNIASFKQTVPKYETTVKEESVDAEGGTYVRDKKITVEERSFDLSLAALDGLRILRADLESGQVGNRGIASGDLLVRTGYITHRQYAGVLQDVLQSPGSTPQDKMRAMVDATGSRFATIVDGVRHEDGGKDPRGKNFGLTSSDLINTLEKVAQDPAQKSRDVRAMATAILYGLSERHVERRAEILQAVNGRWLAQGVKHDGQFANEVIDLLKRDMNSPVSDEPESADLARETKLNAALALLHLAPASDQDLQRKINDAIAQSMSTTNGVLAQRTLDALTPQRMQQLEKDSPLLAQAVRESAISMIKLPGSLDEQDMMVDVLSEMDKIFLAEKHQTTLDPVKAEQLRKLDSRLKDLLNPHSKDGSGHSAYAKFYPELRTKAIEMLSEIGSQDARDVIRYHLTPRGSMKFGNSTIGGEEPDARVRMAAVKALQKLNDVEFPSVATTLVETEPDADIARELREVRFLARQVEPGTPRWDEIKEKWTEKTTFATKIRTELGADFNYEEFIGESSPFKSLKLSTFTRNANADAEDAASDLWPFNDDSERNDSIASSLKQRREQWNALVNQSQQTDKEGLRAKAALYKIIETNANLQGAPGDSITIGSKQRINENYVIMAADALRQLAKPGRGHNDFTRWAIKRLLETNQAGGNPSVMNSLVDGWKDLYTNGSITREDYAVTLGTALSLQLDNAIPEGKFVEENHKNLQRKLLAELAMVKHRELLPVFDAVANGVVTNAGRGGASRFEDVRAEAGRLLSDFQDSVDLLWKQTNVDHGATSEERAERIRAALEGKDRDGKQLSHGDTEKTITEMFNAYRGFKFPSDNDQGLRYLSMALRTDNERIRLAAARIITESNAGANSAAREQAHQALIDLNRESSKPRIREDAGRDLLRSRWLDLGNATPASVSDLMGRVGWMSGIDSGKERRNVSAADSAAKIENLLATDNGRFNYEASARALLSVAKESPLPAEEDPRRAGLFKALTHQSERVRLASAWMLSQSARPSDRDAAVKVLAGISTSASGFGASYEAAQVLSDMIATGDIDDRKRASDAWKEAYSKRTVSSVTPPLSTNDPSLRIEYYARAPLSELENVIANGSIGEKREIAMRLGGISEAELNAWLAPPPQAAFERRPAFVMQSAISCHSGHHKQDDYGLKSFQKLEQDKAKLQHEESKLDDYFRSLMRQGSKFQRTSDVPVWTAPKLGERPKLSGKTAMYRIEDYYGGYGGRRNELLNGFGQSGFDKRISDAEMQKLMEFMKSSK